MRKVCLLGATGSIGDSSLSVINQHSDTLTLHSIVAHSNWNKVLEILKEFRPEKIVMFSKNAADKLREQTSIPVLSGMEGILEVVSDEQVTDVINGMVGSVGCLPTIKSIESNKKVALANKETMVMAGSVINELLEKHPDAAIIPVDSEHSAIFQCLAGRPEHEVHNIQLTASGGPFRNLPKEDFPGITKAMALNHPTWDMGPKITIDSSTLMNKGLEVIEAHYLFQIDYSRIKVVVHPQSIIHSMVQFVDGSLMAQLGCPDMRHPIQYALSAPDRWKLDVDLLNLGQIGKLDFQEPDFEKFPCLGLAFEAGKMGGVAPAVLNAANEVAVDAFLKEKVRYIDIPVIVEKCLLKSDRCDHPSLNEILEFDKDARERTLEIIGK